MPAIDWHFLVFSAYSGWSGCSLEAPRCVGRHQQVSHHRRPPVLSAPPLLAERGSGLSPESLRNRPSVSLFQWFSFALRFSPNFLLFPSAAGMRLSIRSNLPRKHSCLSLAALWDPGRSSCSSQIFNFQLIHWATSAKWRRHCFNLLMLRSPLKAVWSFYPILIAELQKKRKFMDVCDIL